MLAGNELMGLLYFFDWWICKGFVENAKQVVFAPLKLLNDWWGRED